MEKEIFEKLTNIFRTVFKDSNLLITSETTANDVEKWDSITHVELIAAVEEDFNIKFKLKELVAMKSVGDLAQLIINKTQN